MKKQMILFFLLLSIATCNVNAMDRLRRNKPLQEPHRTKAPVVGSDRFNNLFTKYQDQLKRTNELETELKELKDNNQDTTECTNNLEICRSEQESTKKEFIGCTEENEQLKRELEGDDENPGLRTQLNQANEQYGNLYYQINGDENNPGLKTKYAQLRNQIDGPNGLRAQASRASELEVELKNKGVNLDKQEALTKQYSAKSKTFDRLAPYAGGVVLAGGSKAVLSKIKGNSQFLGLLHSAAEDSLWLQVVSSGAALHDDSHTFLNGYSTANVNTSGLMRVSLKNVGAEVATASGLRLLWGKLNKSSNGLVTMVKRLPESVQYVAHEALVRALALSLHGENPFEKMKNSKNS
ncbi:MAG: hypothetical protein WCD44_01100 [Candidatus Babeliales bacterium]